MQTSRTEQIWSVLNIVNSSDLVTDTTLNDLLMGTFPDALEKTATTYTLMLKTIFEMAIYQSENDLVHTLLQKGFSPNFCGDWNTTPLMWASYLHNTSLVQLLLAYGADASVKSFSQKTAQNFEHAPLNCPETRFMQNRKAEIDAQVRAGVFKKDSGTTNKTIFRRTRQKDNGRGMDELLKTIKKKDDDQFPAD